MPIKITKRTQRYICLEKTMKLLDLKSDLDIENAFLQVLDHGRFQAILRHIRDLKQELEEERNRVFNYALEHGQAAKKSG